MSEYYGVQRSSSSLSHYGVKGMRWGVRKQNRDGSLTARGMRKVARRNASYMNPAKRDKRFNRDKEREKVSSAYSKEYWDAISKGMPKNVGSKQGEKLWNKYKDQYAGAVLKDAKMRDTKQGRESVKKLFKQTDPSYMYYNPEYKWDHFGGHDNFNQVNKKYADKRNQIAHPVLHKMKKHTKGLKQDLKDAGKAAALSLVMGGPAANMYVSSRKAVRDNPGTKKKKRR